MAKFCFFLIFAFSSLARAECNFPNVTIEGQDVIELETTCSAIESLQEAFRSQGAVIEPKVRVVFENEVLTPPNAMGEQYKVFGYFDTDTLELHMTKFQSPMQNGRVVWGVAWNKELARSFLVHELSHLLAISYMGEGFKKIAPMWHEAIAYYLQLQLMDEKIRREILEGEGAGFAAYQSTQEVDVAIYQMNPEAFAIKMFKSIHNWGGLEFIKRVMDGAVPGTERTE